MSFWTRCRKCEKRTVMARHPDSYVRQPICERCESRSWRVVKRNRQETCCCDGYHFPHRSGSKCCINHPEGLRHQEERHYGVNR